MARIEKGQTYGDLGFRVDNKGIAYDTTTGQSLSRGDIDQRLAGTDMTNIKHRRGGVAGSYDRNKQWAVPAAELAASLIPGIGPLLSAGIGAATGFDRPGQGGIGYDVGKGAMGAATGYGLGKLGAGVKGALSTAGQAATAAGGLTSGAGAKAALGSLGSSALDATKTALGNPAVLPGLGTVASALNGGGGGGGAGGDIPLWMKALAAGQVANAAALQSKANDYAKSAYGDTQAFWKQRDPLRTQGIANMTAQMGATPMPELGKIGAVGNPFAQRA